MRGDLVARRGDAEAWIPLDEAWLARYRGRALVDVELREMPGVKLGSLVVSFSDSEGAAVAIAAAPAVRPAEPARGPGLSRRTLPIARLFLPLGNWRSSDGEERRGAAGMTVRGSLQQVADAVERNPYLLVSNVLPLLLLAALGLVIGIVEGLAVRTGRILVNVLAWTLARVAVMQGSLWIAGDVVRHLGDHLCTLSEREAQREAGRGGAEGERSHEQ